jgi:hypothetical protein
MQDTSSFLTDHTSENDVVLVEVDIGILSYYSNHGFRIADGAGLASPQLAHLDVFEDIAESRPRYVVESIGTERGGLVEEIPELELIYYQPYRSHGLTMSLQRGNELNFANVYRLS